MRVTEFLQTGPLPPGSQGEVMETVQTGYRVVAGIDVHKKMLAVVVHRQNGEQVVYEKRKFGPSP